MAIDYGDVPGPDERPKFLTTECCQCHRRSARLNTAEAHRPGIKCDALCGHVVCGNCTIVKEEGRTK